MIIIILSFIYFVIIYGEQCKILYTKKMQVMITSATNYYNKRTRYTLTADAFDTNLLRDMESNTGILSSSDAESLFNWLSSEPSYCKNIADYACNKQ